MSAADAVRLFVFGLGYTATAFARQLREAGASVAGTVRSSEKAARLTAEGIDALVFDGGLTDPAIEAHLNEATHLLVSIAPGETGDPTLTHHRSRIIAAPRLLGIAYLSTVGVYGDYGGAWVDERTIPHPSHDRTRERVKSEAAWMEVADRCNAPLGIFRLAGIYGPGRNPLLNLAEGKAHRVIRPGQVFNRIHVADIAAVLAATLTRPQSRIYNVSDDEPAPPNDVIVYAAGLMGVAPPPEVPLAEADLSPMARSFYADNRRVANHRIRQELGIVLRYPTYREGLSALWRDGTWRG